MLNTRERCVVPTPSENTPVCSGLSVDNSVLLLIIVIYVCFVVECVCCNFAGWVGGVVISCLSSEWTKPRATIWPVKCSNSPSQVGKLHRCLVKPDTLDLTEQCKEETGLSVEDLAKAEPLDKVLQQVSPCGRSTRTGKCYETQTPSPCSRCVMWPHHDSSSPESRHHSWYI